MSSGVSGQNYMSFGISGHMEGYYYVPIGISGKEEVSSMCSIEFQDRRKFISALELQRNIKRKGCFP